MTNNNLQQLNDELTNCKKAIVQAAMFTDRRYKRFRTNSRQIALLLKIEQSIIDNIQKAEKVIENRG